jgi:hypothetical protein
MNRLFTPAHERKSWRKLWISGLLALAFAFSAKAQSDPFVQSILVLAKPTVAIVETEVCENDSITLLFSGTAPFTLNYAPGNLGLPTIFGIDTGYRLTVESGPDFNGVTYYSTKVKAGLAGTFTFALVSFVDSMNCDGLTFPPQAHTLTVHPLPVIASLTHNTYCNGERYWGFNLGNYPNEYTWTNIGDYIGLPADGTGNIPSFTIIDTARAILTAEYAIAAVRTYGSMACYAYDTLLISANPTATVDTIYDVDICNHQPVLVNFAGSADHYRWSKISGDNIPGLSGNGLDSIYAAALHNNTGGVLSAVYEVIPEYDYQIGTCPGNRMTFTLTLYPDMVVTSHDTILIMSGEAFAYTSTTALSSADLIWSNGTQGATISETLTNATADMEYHTYTLTISAGGCTATDTITVGVVPDIQIAVADRYLCADAGTTSCINTGSGLDAVITTQAAVTVEYILSGVTTDTLTATLSGVVFNYGVTEVEVTVTHTASGMKKSTHFAVSVHAQPVMTLADETYCAGEHVAEHLFGTGVAVYSWTSTPASIGAGESGTGVMPAFVAENAGTSVIIDTFFVTATIVNPHIVCTAADTFTITVNPVPAVAPVNDITVCSGTPLTIAFTGNMPGNIYNWHRISGYDITPASMGSGSIAATPVNTSGTPVSAVYEVVPVSAEGCAGAPITFTVTVNPEPVLSLLPDAAYCAGATAPAVVFSGNIPAAAYSWGKIAGDNIAGLPSSGTGNMPAFLAANATSTPLVATYAVTMSYAGNGVSCSVADTFDITVYPVPTVTSPNADISICSGDPLNIAFNGQADSYSWHKLSGNMIAGLPASGTGNINIAALSNTGNAPLAALYEVTPSYSFAAGTCQGVPYTFTIMVNPVPALASHTDGDTICSDNMFTYTAASSVPAATFAWSRASVAEINGGTAGSGTGATISEMLTSSSTNAVTVVYQYILDINGCTSSPASSQVSVVVLPAAQALFAAKYEVCADAAEVVLDYTSAATALSYRLLFDVEAQDAGFVSATALTVLPAEGIHVAVPAGVAAGNYHATIIIDSKGCTAEYGVTIHVIPLPAIVSQPQSLEMLCPGQSQMEFSVVATGENLTYQWYFNGTAIPAAVAPAYSVLYDSTMAGTYFVMVMSDCDTLVSDSAEAVTNILTVLEKWGDVLYVDNSDDRFTGYQWYKDGYPLVNETSQYYSEMPFLNGVYRARIYLADGTWIESCDYTFNNSKMLLDKLYPNPAEGGAEITVELYQELTPMSKSTFEMYDMLGRHIMTQPFSGNRFTVKAPATSGTYHLRIVSEEAGVIHRRFVVNR